MIVLGHQCSGRICRFALGGTRMKERMNIQGAVRVPKVERRAAKRRRIRGVLQGTQIATRNGWQTVDTLRPGDEVWTFDDGLQPIVDVERKTLWAREAERKRLPPPVLIPGGALANEEDIYVMPGQGLLLECENACDSMGEPFAVIPVSAIIGICGIEPKLPAAGLALYTVKFADEQAIYIDGGLLLHLPQQPAPGASAEDSAGPRYDVKNIQEAKNLLTDLDLAELALREPYDEFFGPKNIASFG